MNETMQRPISRALAILAASVLFVSWSSAASEDRGHWGVAGSYVALLDLTGLRDDPIETLYVILDVNGSALFVSEHEEDKESTSVGFWRHLRSGKIGLGAASFRYGPAPDVSICGLVGVTSPPGNCVLKIGGTLHRERSRRGLVGEVFITIETDDGEGDVVTLPTPFSIVLEPLSLEHFPGALP